MPSKLRPSHGSLQGTSETGGQRGGTSPPVFERSVDLKSTKGEDYALHIITRPPPDFQTFRHSCLLIRGYISRRLEHNLHGLAERASMAASYLHLPSKSHRGIAKIFAQVNSLQKIIVKNVIRTQKEFFSYCG